MALQASSQVLLYRRNDNQTLFDLLIDEPNDIQDVRNYHLSRSETHTDEQLVAMKKADFRSSWVLYYWAMARYYKQYCKEERISVYRPDLQIIAIVKHIRDDFGVPTAVLDDNDDILWPTIVPTPGPNPNNLKCCEWPFPNEDAPPDDGTEGDGLNNEDIDGAVWWPIFEQFMQALVGGEVNGFNLVEDAAIVFAILLNMFTIATHGTFSALVYAISISEFYVGQA